MHSQRIQTSIILWLYEAEGWGGNWAASHLQKISLSAQLLAWISPFYSHPTCLPKLCHFSTPGDTFRWRIYFFLSFFLSFLLSAFLNLHKCPLVKVLILRTNIFILFLFISFATFFLNFLRIFIENCIFKMRWKQTTKKTFICFHIKSKVNT